MLLLSMLCLFATAGAELHNKRQYFSANDHRFVFFYLAIFLFLKGKYLEEYMVLNMKMGNGKVGRIED
jgi:hypothetical protein